MGGLGWGWLSADRWRVVGEARRAGEMNLRSWWGACRGGCAFKLHAADTGPGNQRPQAQPCPPPLPNHMLADGAGTATPHCAAAGLSGTWHATATAQPGSYHLPPPPPPPARHPLLLTWAPPALSTCVTPALRAQYSTCEVWRKGGGDGGGGSGIRAPAWPSSSPAPPRPRQWCSAPMAGRQAQACWRHPYMPTCQQPQILLLRPLTALPSASSASYTRHVRNRAFPPKTPKCPRVWLCTF